MAWKAAPLSVDENEPLGDVEEIPEAELVAFLDEPLRHRTTTGPWTFGWDPRKHPRDHKGEFTHAAPGAGQYAIPGLSKTQIDAVRPLGKKKTDLVGARLGLDSSGKVVVLNAAGEKLHDVSDLEESPAPPSRPSGADDSALKTVDSEVAAIKAEVKHHKIDGTRDLSFGAMGSVERCRMDDGEELIHKKQGGASEYGDTAEDFKENFGVTPTEANDAEELAPYVSEVFGAGAPAVWRSGKYEQWQQVAPGTMAIEASDDLDEAMNSESGRRIALFDAVINNADRHEYNWLITDDGKAVPIDHGKAFGNYGGSPFVEAHAGEKLSEAEATSMLAKFNALEPKFKKMHREAWFQESRERLMSIIATGIHDQFYG